VLNNFFSTINSKNPKLPKRLSQKLMLKNSLKKIKIPELRAVFDCIYFVDENFKFFFLIFFNYDISSKCIKNSIF